MIFIGFGANLPSRYGCPVHTLEAAKAVLESGGMSIGAASRTWLSAPVPSSDQPWYANAVVAVRTSLRVVALLQALQDIEKQFGRARNQTNAPRTLDLDLLAYHSRIFAGPDLHVPHPRLHERAFVLYPLREIAPHWRHPERNRTVDELIAALPAGQELYPAERMAGKGAA